MRRARFLAALFVAFIAAPVVLVTPAAAAGTGVAIIYAPSSPIVANTSAAFMAHITPYATGRTISFYVNGGLVGQSTTNPNGNASIGVTFGAGGYGIKAVLEPLNGQDFAQSDEFLLFVTPDPAREPDWFFVENHAHPTFGAKGVSAQIAVAWAGVLDDRITITAIDADTNDTLNLLLQTPDGSPLGPGVYTSDRSDLSRRIGQSGTGCGSGSVTQFQILSIERNGAGVPISFALTFSFLCNADQYWPIVGAVRYNSNTPIPSLSLPTASPAFSSVIAGHSGPPRTFQIANDGDANVAIGQVSLGATNASDFSLSSDECSGIEMAPGESCAFDVTFAPATSGPKSAELVIPSDLGLTPRRLPIGGQGLIPESLGAPVVVPEQQYFTPGVWYQSTISPNPAINPGECLVDGVHLDGGISDGGLLRCISPRPEPGEHTVTIHYLGSVFHGEATSSPTTFVVDPSTATTVTLSDETAPSNVPVMVTATVAFDGDVSYPGGILTITDETNGDVIASGEVGPAEPSVVVATTFAAGAHHLVASYGGIPETEDASAGSADLAVGGADLIAPTSSAPAHSYPTGSIVSGKAPVRLTWTGADVGSGVDHYVLRQQSDDGPWSAPWTVATTSQTRMLAPGHTYRFGIRAVDHAGNPGTWGYGATFKLTAISQSSSAVHYAGTWATSTSTTWWGGTARSSSKAWSTASYTFTGKSIAWASLKAPTRGRASIYVNGVYKATVDLYSATLKKQLVVWSANYSTSATRTITIKVLGTVGRPRVDVDGFIVGS